MNFKFSRKEYPSGMTIAQLRNRLEKRNKFTESSLKFKRGNLCDNSKPKSLFKEMGIRDLN